MKLKGRVAVVTGAGMGMGKELALGEIFTPVFITPHFLMFNFVLFSFLYC